MELYAVRERRGGPWNWALGLREQAGFDDHAGFMDGLVDAGFVLLGGPLEGDREVLLIIRLSGHPARKISGSGSRQIRGYKMGRSRS